MANRPKARRKFAINAWVWAANINSNEQEIFSKARYFGYDGIEIPISAEELDRSALQNALSGSSSTERLLRPLAPIIIGGGTPTADLTSLDPMIRNNGYDRVQRCIRFASALGGSLVCGPLYTVAGKTFPYTKNEKEEILNSIAESFRRLSDYAKEFQVKIAVEPLCRYDTSLINTVEQGMHLIDIIGKDNVGLLLDTFHMNIEEKSLHNAIVSAGKKVFHLHACENDRGTPGTGQVRWEEVSRALDDIGYQEWISLESFTPYAEEFSASMKVWRRLAGSQDEIARDGLVFLKRKLG